MAPASLALARDAFLRSVLLRLAPVKLAPASLARVSLARCSTAPDRSAPERSASDRSRRLSGARGSEQFGQAFDAPARNSLSPAAKERLDRPPTAKPSASVAASARAARR